MDLDKELVREWIKKNLVMQDEAMKITGQSRSAFMQSLQSGRIHSFVEFGQKRKTRLYLREDMEEYKRNKKT